MLREARLIKIWSSDPLVLLVCLCGQWFPKSTLPTLILTCLWTSANENLAYFAGRSIHVDLRTESYVPAILFFPYVSLQLRVQNRRTKWNFPLNFRTMHKLSERYSGIFQTQSSGCASGVDHFRNFTKLKILNI